MYSYSTYFLSSPMSLLMHIGRRMPQRAQPRMETVPFQKGAHTLRLNSLASVRAD
jgi:hypothetical protein